MKYLSFVLILLLFTSCEYLNVKKTSSAEILEEELKTFNWNELDVYPTFSDCDASTSKIEKKQCFETIITNHLSDYLANQHLVVSQNVIDTLQLTFAVSDSGDARILDIAVKEETLLILPEIREIIKVGIDSLPEIFPAIKRGQQVTSQYKLPVVISVN